MWGSSLVSGCRITASTHVQADTFAARQNVKGSASHSLSQQGPESVTRNAAGAASAFPGEFFSVGPAADDAVAIKRQRRSQVRMLLGRRSLSH